MTVLALSDRRHFGVVFVVACGCLAIAYKPVNHIATVTLVMLGVAGMIIPVPRARIRAMPWVTATAVGLAAFSIGRALASPIGVKANIVGVLSLVVAGICEEIFFRRLIYGSVLARAGEIAALVSSSVLFALVHVPLYGWKAFPIDLAAGLILGWQRQVSGSWTSPAVTHIAANLMQLG